MEATVPKAILGTAYSRFPCMMRYVEQFGRLNSRFVHKARLGSARSGLNRPNHIVTRFTR